MTQRNTEMTDSPILCNKVYQSNPLIGARKNFDLIGMKIFLLGLQGLNPHFSTQDKIFDNQFKEFLVPAAKLKKVFGNNWYLYEIKTTCKKLFNSTIEVDHPNGVIKLSHLFRRLEYVPSKGLYIWFDDVLRPYILDLLDTQGFTQVDSASLLKLSSPYAIRLLELMLQYRNFEKFRIRREITRSLKLNELRFMLNVPEGTYQGRLNNFKKFVLENPMREINERTNYRISFRTIKDGRRVVGFEFKLDTRLVPDAENNERRSPLVHDAIKALKSLGFTEKVAFTIFGKCLDVDDCFSRINRAQALLARSKTPVINREGFLRKAIEQDWRLFGDRRRPRIRPNIATKKEPPAKELLENEMSTNEMSTNETFTKKRPRRASSTQSIGQVLAPVLQALKKAAAQPVEIKKDVIVEDEEDLEPPEKPNKYGIPPYVVQDIKDWIKAGKDLNIVRGILEGAGITLEQFMEEFMKE